MRQSTDVYGRRKGNPPALHPSTPPRLIFLFLLSSPRYTPSGFELCFHRATGEAQGPPYPALGTDARTQELGVGKRERVLYSKQGGSRLRGDLVTSSFCVVVVVSLLLLCSGGTASPFRDPEHTSRPQPSPASPLPPNGRDTGHPSGMVSGLLSEGAVRVV